MVHTLVKLSDSARIPRCGALEDDREVDWESKWSEEAKLRTPALLQTIGSKFDGVPGLIRLGGGFPPEAAFPLTGLQITARGLGLVDMSGQQEVCAAQQYSMSSGGLPELKAFLHDLTARVQQPPREFDEVLTNGATHAIDLAMGCMLNAGDSVLCDEYAFFHIIDTLFKPRGYTVLPVALDRGGLVPASLRAHLEAFDRGVEGRPAAKKPRVLYTVPHGQNPTGACLSTERKQEIYQICREHDLVIVEDDAYTWLQYPGGEAAPPLLDGLSRGFLSMDVDGRVIRVDTMSKLLGPGYRLGWISGNPAMVAKVKLAVSAATIGPCSLSMVVVAAICRGWGMSGFEAHVGMLQRMYAHKAAVVQAAAELHLEGLAEWTPVQAGMFLWLRLTGIERSLDVLDELVEAKVLAVAGQVFWVRRDEPGVCCPFLRISFSVGSDEDLVEGMRRMGVALRAWHDKHPASPAPDGLPSIAAAPATAARVLV